MSDNLKETHSYPADFSGNTRPDKFLDQALKEGGEEYTSNGKNFITIFEVFQCFLYHLMREPAGVRFESTRTKGVFVWCDFEAKKWFIEC